MRRLRISGIEKAGSFSGSHQERQNNLYRDKHVIESKDPFTKAELLESFAAVHQEVATYFSSIALENFFHGPAGKWSPAENLLHLIKSVKSVTMVMKMPRWLLRLLFGKLQTASRRFAQIKETYQRALANGGKASGRYIPSIHEVPSHPDQYRNNLAQKWNTTGESLIAILRNWKDENLDEYLLPHPILGKLTIREMLFFTLYHDLHHVNNMRKLLEKSLFKNITSNNSDDRG